MEVIEGAKLLADEWGVGSDIWSATSFTLLAREAQRLSVTTACTPPPNRVSPT